MGVCRTIWNAVFGPLLIFTLFAAHAAYNTFGASPAGGVVIADFPRDTTAELRDAIVGSRKPLIKDVMGVLQGKLDDKDFLKR